MLWLAVRAWSDTEGEGVEVVPGVAEAVAVALPVGVGLGVAELPPVPLVAGTLVATCGKGGGVGPNSVELAGTSLENEVKISSSSGCVHSTFAVSEGTTSERGKVGTVKKAILLDGMPRSDCPRS